jgi:hypothetical protein
VSLGLNRQLVHLLKKFPCCCFKLSQDGGGSAKLCAGSKILQGARELVSDYVAYYNTVRLHSDIGFVTPNDKLEGREKAIFAERDRKLGEARERRKTQRQTPPAESGGQPL